MRGRDGAVCGVWEGVVRRCWGVLAAIIFDIWRCVRVLCVRCVGSLNENNLGEEVKTAIKESAPEGCEVYV